MTAYCFLRAGLIRKPHRAGGPRSEGAIAIRLAVGERQKVVTIELSVTEAMTAAVTLMQAAIEKLREEAS